MAQDTDIGIRIKLGGVSQAVTSIKELEEAILAARRQLATLDVSSEAFKKLSTEIQTADGKLKDLKKSSEGISFEKKLSDFTKFGAGVTSAFAAATAAINLFGGDTEKVSKAAAQAQNVLTIAVAARGIAEGITAAKTVGLTIATNVSNIATKGFTASLRALWATMLANPITAILAVLGALIAAVVLYTAATDDAAKKEEEYQEQLKKGNEEQERKIRLLKANGASAKEVAIQEAKDAENNFNKARFYLLNTAKDTALYAQRKKEYDEAELVMLEKNRVVQNIKDEEREASEKELDDNRKKRSEADKLRREKELQALLQTIRLTEELNRAELLRNATGQKFVDLGVVFELEKQNLEYIRLKNVLGDTSTLQEKYSKTFKDTVERDRIVLEGYTKDTEESKQALATGIVQGIITPETFERIASERAKFNTNLKLIQTALTAAKTDIQKTDLSKTIREQLEIETGVGKSFEQLQTARLNYAALEKQFIQDFVKANTDLTKSGDALKTQQEELTKTGQQYFNVLVENQKQVLLYEDATMKLTNQFELAKVANENFAKSGEAVNGFIRENIDLIAESLDVDLYSITTNQQGILALEAAILGKRKDVYKIFAYDIEIIEKELAKKGIDITAASEEEKLRILYEYIKKRQTAMDGENDDFIAKLEKNIEAFRNMFNQIGQQLAQGLAFEFEYAEMVYKDSLSQITKDTENSAVKRLEAEKIYQGKVAELQKKQTKLNLQLTLTQAIADAAAAIITITKQTGIFATIAAAIAATSSLVQIGNIQKQINRVDSFQGGGFIKGQGGLVVGPSHEYGGVKYAQGGVELEGGEAVINRVSSVRYSGLLSEINQAGGGKPMVVNNFDDSRIVEALAKQRKEPLRAYVVEQDITNAQQVNRRLESLSQI